MSDTWRWPHFTPDEMRCKGTGKLKIVPAFMDRLELLRVAYDRPIFVSSGYRAPYHNAIVSRTGATGPHTTGRAIDTPVYGEHAYNLVRLAKELSFTGIGFKQHGPHDRRFIHLDDLENGPGCPRPWVWSYS